MRLNTFSTILRTGLCLTGFYESIRFPPYAIFNASYNFLFERASGVAKTPRNTCSLAGTSRDIIYQGRSVGAATALRPCTPASLRLDGWCGWWFAPPRLDPRVRHLFDGNRRTGRQKCLALIAWPYPHPTPPFPFSRYFAVNSSLKFRRIFAFTVFPPDVSCWLWEKLNIFSILFCEVRLNCHKGFL